MDNGFKKKLIAYLLAAACLVSGLFLSIEETDTLSKSTAKVDSLLLSELHAFNIPPGKIRQNRIDVTENFYRKNYTVNLPAGVSKTWVHSEISRKLYDHDMTTWATVDFPERDMNIHVLSDHTIIRTIEMIRDTSYVRFIHPAVVMFYFDKRPDESLLNRLSTIPEPITLVLRVRTSAQAREWSSMVKSTGHNWYFWMIDDDQLPGADFNESLFLEQSRLIADASTQTGLLFFHSTSFVPGRSFLGKLEEQRINLVKADNSGVISRLSGRQQFDEEFRNFTRKAMQGRHPTALIQASEDNLDWFLSSRNTLKKGGIMLTYPRLINP